MGKYLINWSKANKTEITDELLAIIANARKSIKIGNFIFEYQPVINALKAAMDKDVAVFILSNPLDDKNPKDDSRQKDEYKSHLSNLMQLASLGAHVRYLNDLHAKFVICDDITGIVTSANNNQNSLNHNSETGVTIQGQDVAQLTKVYNQLFLNADITKISDSKIFRIKSRQRSKGFIIDIQSLLASNIRITLDSDKNTNLRGKDINLLYDKIVNIIDRSEKECFIVTWHFNCIEIKEGNSKEYNLLLKKFLTSLRQAKKRGVKITLYSNVYDTSSSQYTKNKPSLAHLAQIVDEIYSDDNNHSKCVITESEGIVFSANIDPAGLETGFEVGVVLSEEERRDALEHIHNLISANPNKIIL